MVVTTRVVLGFIEKTITKIYTYIFFRVLIKINKYIVKQLYFSDLNTNNLQSECIIL